MSTAADEPGWLVAAVDQRVALLMDKAGNLLPEYERQTLVFTVLTEPTTDKVSDYKRWDRTCDRCGTFVPSPDPFYTGHSQRVSRHGQRIFISYGLCEPCIQG